MANNETKIILTAVDNATSSINSVKNAVTGAIGPFQALAGAAGAFTIANLIKGAIDGAGELQKLSEKTGATVEALSALKVVAKLSGTDLEQVGGGLSKLAKNMYDAAAGGGKAQQAFTELGLSVKNSGGQLKDGAQFMQEVAIKLVGMENGTQRAAYAVQIFGKAGANLLPLLNDLATAGELQGKVSAEMAAQADKLEKQMARLQGSMKGVWNDIAAGALPALNSLAELFIQNSRQADSWKNAITDLKKDGSLTSWADDSARAVAGLMDATGATIVTFKMMGKSIRELAVDLDMLNKLTPLGMAKGFATQGMDYVTNVIKQRNDEVAALNVQLDQSIKGYGGNLDRLNAIIAGRKPAAVGSSGGTQPEITTQASAEAVKVYDQLIKSIAEKTAAEQLEAQGVEKLTEGQKLAVKVMTDLRDGTLALTTAQKQKLTLSLEEYLLAEKTNDARRDQLKWSEEWRKALDQEGKSLAEQVTKAQEHLDAIGATLEEQDKLKASKFELAAATEAEYAANLRNAAQYAGPLADAYTQAANAADARAEALRRLASIETQSAAKQVAVDAAKQAADEWKRFSDSIEQSLTDALMQGFQNGKSFGQSFVDSLKHTLETAALKIVVQAIVSPIMGSVGNALGISAAGTSGSNLLSGLSLASAGSNAANWITGGQSLAAGFSSAGGAGAMYGGAGNALANFGANSLGITNATALAGLQIVPQVAAIYAGVKMLQSVFDSGGGPKVGGDATYQAGMTSDWQGGMYFTETQANAAMATTLSEFVKGLQSTVEKLGGKLNNDLAFSVGAASDPQGTAADRIASQLKNASGQTIYQHTADVTRGSSAQELPNELNRLMLAALQQADIPAWAKVMVDKIDPVAASSEQVTKAITALNTAMEQFSNATAGRQAMLDSFMSDSEKLSAAQKALTDAGLPNTAAAFKAMAEGLDLTTTSGQDALAKMLNLRGALDLVTAAASAADSAAAERAKAIAAERSNLQDQYDALTLTSAQLLEKQRNALDETNRALFDSINAEKARQASIAETARLAEQTAAEAAARAQAVAAERSSLQDQYDALTLTSTQLQEKQRAALAETNRALFDSINAEKERQAGIAETARLAEQTAAEAAARAQAVAAERSGLQNQLDALTLSNAQLLEKQRNALDETNRALFDQVQAAQAAQAAEKSLAAARQQALSDAMAGVSTAYSGLQRAVQAERDSITSAYNVALDDANTRLQSISATVAKLTGLSDALKSSVASIRPPSRIEAQAQIQTALTIAKAGGPLPDADALRQALSVLAQPSQQLFASFEDFQRDQQKTANSLKALGTLTDNQVAIEKHLLDRAGEQIQTLKDGFDGQMIRLDGILADGQAQIDALNNIDNSVKSVKDAMAILANSISNAIVARTVAQDTPPGSTSGSSAQQFVTGLYATYADKSPSMIDAEGLNYWIEQLTLKTAAEVAADFQRSVKVVRGYATGGSFGGGLRIVGESGPELEYTGPSRILSNTDSKKLFDVETLRAEIAELRADLRSGLTTLAINTAQTAKQGKEWTTQGIPVRALDPSQPIDVAVAP